MSCTHNSHGFGSPLCTCRCCTLCTRMPDACFTHPDDVNVFIEHVPFFQRNSGNRVQGRDAFLYRIASTTSLCSRGMANNPALQLPRHSELCAVASEVHTVCVRRTVGVDSTPVRVVVLLKVYIDCGRTKGTSLGIDSTTTNANTTEWKHLPRASKSAPLCGANCVIPILSSWLQLFEACSPRNCWARTYYSEHHNKG